MTRDAINLTISEPLRRAHVRQRLDALAQITGLAQAQLAGRALTIGLGHIETDLTLIFPGVAAPSEDHPSPPAPVAAPPGVAGHNDAQPSAAAPPLDAPPTAPASHPEPAPATPPQAALDAAVSRAEPPAPPLPRAEPPAPAPPRAEPPELVTSKAAAIAMGHGTASAFAQHCHRHPELRRCAQKVGHLLLWDLAKLRAAYQGQGWQLKRGRKAAARQR